MAEDAATGVVGAVRGWGTTADERSAPYPCDAHLEDPTNAWFRAIGVDAPVATTFRWLCQLRAAPYSYDLIDNFGRRSPRTLTPGLGGLERGQKVMMFYELVDFEPDGHLTAAFRFMPWMIGQRLVTYAVRERPDGGSRIVVKIVHRRPRGPWGRFVVGPMLPRVDLIMMRKQLRNLKKRAEETPATALLDA